MCVCVCVPISDILDDTEKEIIVYLRGSFKSIYKHVHRGAATCLMEQMPQNLRSSRVAKPDNAHFLPLQPSLTVTLRLHAQVAVSITPSVKCDRLMCSPKLSTTGLDKMATEKKNIKRLLYVLRHVLQLETLKELGVVIENRFKGVKWRDLF